MPSAYASAVGIGVHGGTWAVHLSLLPLITFVSAATMFRCRANRRGVIVMSMAWSVLASPYVYDYDLAILTVAGTLFSGSRLCEAGTWIGLNLLASLCIVQSIGLA